jgi:hypothetical protein
MLEAINSGSIAILCKDYENLVPLSVFTERGLVREESEYCLVIGSEYLIQYVSMLRGYPEFLKNLFNMQSARLRKDFNLDEF